MENTVTMSFDNGRNRVRIQKSTLEALGNPRHILMLYNKNKRKFVLQPITIDEARQRGISLWCIMDIPDEVYINGRHYEYQNKNIMPWIRTFTDWKPFAQYRVKGTIYNGIAFMNLDDYDIIVGGAPLRIVG